MSDQPIRIRRAAPADAGTIAAITEAAYSKYIARIGRMPRPMMENYHQVVAEHPVWMLSLDERIVGLLVLLPEPKAMLIYSVAIDPGYQKRGLGRRLLDWAETQAREAGYTRIRLYTNEHMVENIALYQRLGYVETGREPVGDTALVHMAKALKEA